MQNGVSGQDQSCYACLFVFLIVQKCSSDWQFLQVCFWGSFAMIIMVI